MHPHDVHQVHKRLKQGFEGRALDGFDKWLTDQRSREYESRLLTHHAQVYRYAVPLTKAGKHKPVAVCTVGPTNLKCDDL